jgi:hypothetical protein
MSAAQNFVSNFSTRCNVSDYNLFTLNDHNAANCSSIMGGTCTAPAQGFDLQGIDSISKFNKSG